MMTNFDHILAKGPKQGGASLVRHLREVSQLANAVAIYLNLDKNIVYKGAVLHDIGKVSPEFQKTLDENYLHKPGFFFRHEVASLFFLSLLTEEEKYPVIEMVVAHHKSVYKDAGGKGLLDMVETDPDCLDKHLQGFEYWVDDALSILGQLGIEIKSINRRQAEDSFWEAVDYCEKRPYGYSEWKGVLIAADHLASALDGKGISLPENLFMPPDLQYYHSRKSDLYSLSLTPVSDSRKHTMVTAPTGAGKTDFLLRRCKGRVFYTLPFQASINAMYERIKTDLKDTGADVRLLHASSSLKIEEGSIEEKILQRHIGASVKVLTPHQLASIVFATKGYEALIVDLKGCDIILDEIHTYSDTMQSIVLKIVEILDKIGCRLHIGTATMPTGLYCKLLTLLGGKENVYEVKLPEKVLDTFDRHIVYKAASWDSLQEVVRKAVEEKQKILLVCNQVKRAQELYNTLSESFPMISRMLIHSRFKRRKRNELENDLKEVFNKSTEACFVVSTQVVEVSLDISFDLMVTESAPIDALIQRFGRINRKRTASTIGKYKPIYVLFPPDNERDARPYTLDVLERTFCFLPDGELLKERNIQQIIDNVYPEVSQINIDLSTVFNNGKWLIKKLRHYPKSALLESLNIDSVSCIDEKDRDIYEKAKYQEQVRMEIPVSYSSVGFLKLDRSSVGSRPYIIPHRAYDESLGLITGLLKTEFYDTSSQFL